MKTFTRHKIVVSGLLLTGFLGPALQAHAQGGVPLWTNRYTVPGNSDNAATAIAVDSHGNVFVTGASATNGYPHYDYATVAYSNSGLPLWTNRYNATGNGNDEPSAIVVDGSGNVFVTGGSIGIGSGSDYATIKYSNAGVPLWTNRYNGSGNGDDIAFAIAVDSTGNVFVTGRATGSGGDFDYATIKYSGAGVPLWTNCYNGPGNSNDAANAIAVDHGGNVFVAGISFSGNDYSSSDYATVAYSNAGIPLWTNRYDGPGNGEDTAFAIAADCEGNVFVAGRSVGVASDPNSSYFYFDYATVAYSGTGIALWTNRYDGPGNSYDCANAVAVDNNGNVFVTGGSTGINGLDYATVKYSGAGVPLWTNRYNGPRNDDDQAFAIAVDSIGNVFVTGGSFGSSSVEDYATLAYSSEGLMLWTRRYDGPGNSQDLGRAIAVDQSGNVFVTGAATRSGANGDYATIKYSSSIPPVRLDFQKLNNQLVLSWTNAGFNLQSAPSVSGTFTNIPGAANPYTNALNAPQQYFRLGSP